MFPIGRRRVRKPKRGGNKVFRKSKTRVLKNQKFCEKHDLSGRSLKTVASKFYSQ